MDGNTEATTEKRMTCPELQLEEQLSDQRSSYFAFELTLFNSTDATLYVDSVDSSVPMGARILEVTDSSLAQSNQQRAVLLQELNRLLRQQLWANSADFRKTWVDSRRAAYRDIGGLAAMLVDLRMLMTPFSFESSITREFSSLAFRMMNAADARMAYQQWIAPASAPVGEPASAGSTHPASATVRSLFNAKLEQLERIEKAVGEGGPGFAVEPGGAYTATYVLKLERGFINLRKYQLAFSMSYRAEGQKGVQVASAATNVQVSPSPVALSIVAFAAALLGVLLQKATAGSPHPFRALETMAQTGHLWVAPVIALIVFNVYEYTALGKGIKMGVSWRSAVLIGALCGLSGKRMLDAINALIGT